MPTDEKKEMDMGKKYLKDEDEYEWNDEYEWDDSYSEYDDRFEDVEDVEEEEMVKKTKSSTKSGKSASGTKNGTKTGAKSSVKSGSSASKKSSTKSGSGKGKKVSAKKKRRRRMMIAVTLIEILLLAVVCVGLFVMSKVNTMQVPTNNDVKFGSSGDVKVNSLDSGTIEKMQGYTTYAVFGLDKRNQESLEDGQSDVIMIVSVNKDTGEINMVSVYRDTYLQIDDSGAYGKINAAYNRGGAVQAIEALNTNLDLTIDHYVTVNWYAVAQAIDLIGGVDVEVTEDIFYARIPDNLGGGYYLNSYIETTAASTGLPVTYIEGPGYQNLNGLQAVALCRIRQVGMDYGRAETQRQVVAQAFEKAKKANLATLIDVAGSVFPNVLTDMTLSEIAALLPDITKYYMDQSAGFPSNRGGAYMSNSAGTWGDCIIPKDLLTNVSQLHQILYDNYEYSPSQEVINISERISRETGIYAN